MTLGTSDLGQAAGWHGKLPTVGDFASRRLDSDFIRMWDDWVSAGLAELRTMGDGQWLEAYLGSPAWRFVLTPGFLGAPLHTQVWAGVVIPSVDKVGRYYPLTLAYPLPQIPTDAVTQAALWSWLHRLEDLAIDALQEDWSIESMEAELVRLGLPLISLAGNEHGHVSVDPSSPSATFFSACLATTSAADVGRCVWYSEADLPAPQLLCSTSMDDSILRLWKMKVRSH
ncbi:MAG: type VI secretion system-associated protein TagF [Deltaproteobacteria bacterium]